MIEGNQEFKFRGPGVREEGIGSGVPSPESHGTEAKLCAGFRGSIHRETGFAIVENPSPNQSIADRERFHIRIS